MTKPSTNPNQQTPKKPGQGEGQGWGQGHDKTGFDKDNKKQGQSNPHSTWDNSPRR
jgi:hypothetical protein